MGGSCIELTRTSPVAVAAVKIEASQLPPSIELVVSLSCHTLQQIVKYLGFYLAIKLASAELLMGSPSPSSSSFLI